jgi:release factor glutamine methyltransferase
MGLNFEVNEHTLIPRPDTEIAVEVALDMIKQTKIETVLDLCTGSGCIAVSLCKLCQRPLRITASDISPEALEIAKKNANRHRVPISFVQSDLFSDLNPDLYDLTIANPPYIPRDEIDTLPHSVKDYEPHSALDGGADGLDFYRTIIKKTVNNIILEIGYNQADGVKNILEQNSFKEIQIIKDLAGHNRVVAAHKDG